MSFELILATPPENCKNALLWGIPLAHMAYKTCGAYLYRAKLPDALRRGLMLITNMKASETRDTERLKRHILSECANRSYSGVIADFEPPCPFAGNLLSALNTELKRHRLAFYVSEWAAGFVNECKVILTTAVTGGTLLQRLKDCAQKYSRGNIILDLEILSHDFLLPAHTGHGQRITHKRINELIEYTGAKPQFSEELCCHYFTYKSRQGLHFVLYDDSYSVYKKIELAQKLGIEKAILFYPEVNSTIIETALSFCSAL
ncbi:MAG: hypothetical protein GX254_05725 [Clostridiales bacterium]|jgi:hypothetical protein|nr:hypothetical protein [Clostridiales bacterium]